MTLSRNLGVLAFLLASAVAMGACSKKDASTTPATTTAAASPAASAVKAVDSAGSPLKTCAECEASSACSELMQGCSKFSGDEAKACDAVKECVQRTGCGQGKKTFTSCYCGSLGTADCLAAPFEGKGAPAGDCREPIVKAYATVSSSSQVLTRFIETEYPGGAALARLNCLKLNCQRECSFDKEGPAAAGTAAPK